MTTKIGQQASPRIPLARERVLNTAVDIADRFGLESVTMRKIGMELGVEAMSLYNHVANKEDILNGMVEVVMSEIELPSDGVGWKPAMRRRAISVYRMLAAHPWVGTLIDSLVSDGPVKLGHHEWVLRNLRESGFSLVMAAHAFAVMDAYIYGFSTQERNMPLDNEEDLAEATALLLQMLPREQYPYLTEMIVDHALRPGYDHSAEFEYGLDLILDALERDRASN